VSERVDVLVIGGGVIGVSCAYFLARRGVRPVLVERDEICSRMGSTFANAGLVVPSDVEPLATPGALQNGLRWLLDPSSPFWIRPRLCPHQWSWLRRFRRSCTAERARAGMRPLRELGAASSALFDELTDSDGPPTTYHRNGWLFVYDDRRAYVEAAEAERTARTIGVRSEFVDPATLKERVPQLVGDPAGGVYYPEDGHVRPDRFVAALAERARALGADLRSHTEVLHLAVRDGRIVEAVTSRGYLKPQTVVLAAGAWSPHLTRPLGFDLPIQPAKGYSVTVPRPDGFPELPLYDAGHHVCVTPMGDTLRMAGTLELSGYETTMRPRRLAGIVRGGAALLGAAAEQEPLLLWHGPRPLSPDGLPFIGRAPHQENLVIASGHCMLGLSLGPATGRLVAELVTGERPSLDPEPFAPDRFGTRSGVACRPA